MKSKIYIFIALVSFLATGATPAGKPVTFDENKLTLLQGRWAGTFEARGQDGRVYNSDSVTLEISSAIPAKGKFTLGAGNTWETTIAAKEGKVVLGYDRGTREFTLMQISEGKLMLACFYDSQFQGSPRSIAVFLHKQ